MKPANPYFAAAVEIEVVESHVLDAKKALEDGAAPKALRCLGKAIQAATKGMEEIFLITIRRAYKLKGPT
jgi:hypothetical protein